MTASLMQAHSGFSLSWAAPYCAFQGYIRVSGRAVLGGSLWEKAHVDLRRDEM
jgi:hypothetical protein